MRVRGVLVVLGLLAIAPEVRAQAAAAVPAVTPAIALATDPAAQTTRSFARIYVDALSRYLTAEEQAALPALAASDDVGASYRAADRALRVVAPLALDAQGLTQAAQALRDLPSVTNADAAARAHSAAMGLYSSIPFRRGNGLRVSSAESCLLAAMSSVRMLADSSEQRGARALRFTPDGMRSELVAVQAARAAGQALETVTDRAAVLEAALGVVRGVTPQS